MVQIKSLQTGIKFKDTPIGKIPVDWEAAKLGDVVLAFYNGGTPNTKIKEYWDGNIPWITGADFLNQKVSQIRKHITPKGLTNSATNIIPKGNLLVVTRTGVGKLAIAPFDVAISQDITGVIVDQHKTTSNFLYWNLNYHAKQLKTLKQGTSINGILREDLSAYLITLPPLLEQNKITEIFSTVDDAIEKTNTIIEKTKELKKGLMQKLLTRGIGHKKFKKTEIGEIPEGWNVYTVEDIAAKEKNAIKSGPFGSELKKSIFVKSGYKVYGQEQVIPDNFSVGNYYISEDTFNRLKDFEIRPGDILISLVGTFGKISVVPDNVEKGIINPRLIKITLDKGKAFPLFIKFLLTSPQTQKQMLNYTHGLTMGILNTKTVKSLVFPIPPLDEQAKITNVLLGIDAEMMIELDHRNRLQTLKNSLMQVLLTGRVRVKLH